jgi:hypothetical protein
MYLYKYLGVTEAEEKQQCLELAREAGLNIPAITKTVSGGYGKGSLNAWERWAVTRGLHKHRGPMLIYVCCDLL